MCGQTWSGTLESVIIFILAEGQKLIFGHYQVEKEVWCKHFVNLASTLTSHIQPSTQLGDLCFKVVLP